MPEVCIDANIAVKWVVPGERWRQKARLLLRDAAAANVTLIAPPLFEYETESVLQLFVYSVSMTTTRADSALDQIADADVHLLSVPGMVLRARQIARRYDQERIYDSLYAALAELRGCEFWTADTRFYDAVRSELSYVKHLQDYPDTL